MIRTASRPGHSCPRSSHRRGNDSRSVRLPEPRWKFIPQAWEWFANEKAAKEIKRFIPQAWEWFDRIIRSDAADKVYPTDVGMIHRWCPGCRRYRSLSRRRGNDSRKRFFATMQKGVIPRVWEWFDMCQSWYYSFHNYPTRINSQWITKLHSSVLYNP